MMEKVESNLADVEAEMAEGEANKPKRKVKKVAKKSPKKVAKKSKKADKPESTEGKVTLAELASEAEITTASARRKLRDAELSREGRWSWDEGSKGLAQARKALGIGE